jgi:hypothetical protein
VIETSQSILGQLEQEECRTLEHCTILVKIAAEHRLRGTPALRLIGDLFGEVLHNLTFLAWSGSH